MTEEPYPDNETVPLPIAEIALVPVIPAIPVVAVETTTTDSGITLLNQNKDSYKSPWLIFKGLKPLQQLTIGSVLGMALTLSMTGLGASSKTAVPMAALLSSSSSTPKTAMLSLELMRRGFRETVAMPLQALPPQPVPFNPQGLQPIMMDRFYLPAQVVLEGQPQTTNGSVVVDRFYFSHPPKTNAATPSIPQEVYAVHEILSVPSLPSGANSPQPLANLPLSPSTSPAVVQPVKDQSSLLAQPHTLVGVVKTSQFSAALFKTDDTSYAVRLGDNLGQGQLQLVEVNERAVTLSDGQKRIVLNVGESF
jgi:hypothetical protein